MGVLNRHIEFADQVEGVIAVEAGRVEGFGEDHRQQDHDRPADPAPRQTGQLGHVPSGRPRRSSALPAAPVADREKHRHRQQRRGREPGDARLTPWDHDKGGQHRPERRADIAADLEQRLRQAVAPARSHPGDTRGLRVEDRGTDADQCGRKDEHRIARSARQQQKADERDTHADRERIGLRTMVGEHPDRRLQH